MVRCRHRVLLGACLLAALLAAAAAADGAGRRLKSGGVLNGTAAAATAATAAAAAAAGPKLLFSDEFDKGRLDARKWDIQVGTGCQYGVSGWGNAERQHYDATARNIRVRDGTLALRAVHDPASPDRPFTSARIRTWGKFSVAPSQRYPLVRIEARMRVPAGAGLWSAFWLLPQDGSNAGCTGCGRYGGWAQSGEIDVMEIANDGKQLSGKSWGTIHYGGPWPTNVYATNTTTHPTSFAAGFHTYRLDWRQGEMRWFVDGRQYFVARSGHGDKSRGWYSTQKCAGEACWNTPARARHAPFDQKFYLILNLALGSQETAFTRVSGAGITEEQLKATLATPKSLTVDWVRVWGLPA